MIKLQIVFKSILNELINFIDCKINYTLLINVKFHFSIFIYNKTISILNIFHIFLIIFDTNIIEKHINSQNFETC